MADGKNGSTPQGKHAKEIVMPKKKRSGKAKVLIVLGCIVIVIIAACVFLKAPGSNGKEQIEPFTKQPIAHRGYFDNDSDKPENTLPAFQSAIDHGYAIELDTQLTADGTVVVLHDKSLLRTSGVDKNIGDVTDAELAEYRIFDTNEKVPTPQEVLDLIDGLPCFAWTLKSQEQLDQARAAGFDAFIFDSFEAKL